FQRLQTRAKTQLLDAVEEAHLEPRAHITRRYTKLHRAGGIQRRMLAVDADLRARQGCQRGLRLRTVAEQRFVSGNPHRTVAIDTYVAEIHAARQSRQRRERFMPRRIADTLEQAHTIMLHDEHVSGVNDCRVARLAL